MSSASPSDLDRAARLASMGLEVRSAELEEAKEKFEHWAENGNRALRRQKPTRPTVKRKRKKR